MFTYSKERPEICIKKYLRGHSCRFLGPSAKAQHEQLRQYVFSKNTCAYILSPWEKQFSSSIREGLPNNIYEYVQWPWKNLLKGLNEDYENTKETSVKWEKH